MPKAIYINQLVSVSPLGADRTQIKASFDRAQSKIQLREIEGEQYPLAFINGEVAENLGNFLIQHRTYQRLDRSTQLALFACQGLDLETLDRTTLGINIGSSRGATGLLENYYEEFTQTGQVSPYASPTTTTGNLSSWVGQHLGAGGVQFDQSVTCSTAMHALLNGIAWLEAGMAKAFIAGGAEAALTPFTLAQMNALKIMDRSGKAQCRSLDLDKKDNSMVLGEAASLALLSKEAGEDALLKIVGFGLGTEALSHPSSLSQSAECFQQSMKAALKSAELKTVDAIVLHAPGTVLGDIAEVHAIDAVFGDRPFLTSNKWMVGHSFGASGMISLEQALWMIQYNQPLENPYFENLSMPDSVKTVLINAVGFGGNAVSLIVQGPAD